LLLAFITNMDIDGIYVAHLLSLFPADISDPTMLDGLTGGLLDDQPTIAAPVAFPAAFFTMTTAEAMNTLTEFQGMNCHGAILPMFCTGPHVAGAADTDNLTAHRAMVLPCPLDCSQQWPLQPAQLLEHLYSASTGWHSC
jgi:hypothetical protein